MSNYDIPKRKIVIQTSEFKWQISLKISQDIIGIFKPLTTLLKNVIFLISNEMSRISTEVSLRYSPISIHL